MDRLFEAAAAHFWWVIAGISGRMLFHTREAQAGNRRFWGRELPFELLVALGMGLIGYSLCSWFELAGPVAAGVISAVAYLGPRAIDTMFDRALEAGSNFFGKGKGK